MGSADVRLGRYTVMRNLTTDLAIASDGDIHVMLRTAPQDKAQAFAEAARIAQKIEHPNVVRVLEVGDDAFASEYFHAEDARAILETLVKAKAQLPIQHALAIAMGAAAGLHAAHELRAGDKKAGGNILHRDVSPSNILVARDGTVKLVDFEIARALGAKPAYMSPEEVRGQAIDRRSDVYVLGIVLYELATTSRLFRGDLAMVRDAIVTGKVPLPRVRRPDVPNELGIIIMRALAVDPARRFQSAEEMRQVLEQFAQAADLMATPRQLGDYVKRTCGERLEPWRVEGFKTGTKVVASGSDASSSSSGSGRDSSAPIRPSLSKQASWLDGSAKRGGGGDPDPMQTGPVKRGSRPSGQIVPDSTGSFRSVGSSRDILRDSQRRPSRPSTPMPGAPVPMATDWDAPKATPVPASGGSLLGKLAIPAIAIVVLGAIALVVMYVMNGGDKKSSTGTDTKTGDRPTVAPTMATDPTAPPTTPTTPPPPQPAGSDPGPAQVGSAAPVVKTPPKQTGGTHPTTVDPGDTTQPVVSSGSSVPATDPPPDAAPAVVVAVDAAPADGSAATAPMIAQLSGATVDNVARDHQGEVGTCDSSDLHGTLVIAFQIDANGRVTSSQLTSTAGKVTAAVCYLKALKSWQFPHPPTGAARGTYAVTFP